MKLPREIPIRGTKWLVKLEDVVMDGKGELVHATCCVDHQTIELEKELKPIRLLEFFLHEYIHAVWFETGIDDEDNVPKWVEHMIIVPLARDIVNNRKLFSKILGAKTWT